MSDVKAVRGANAGSGLKARPLAKEGGQVFRPDPGFGGPPRADGEEALWRRDLRRFMPPPPVRRARDAHERDPMRTVAIAALALFAALACIALAPSAHAAGAAGAQVVEKPTPTPPGPASAAPRYGLVVQDATPLRAVPRAAGAPLATLGQGELVELRGARMDYLQVYDPARERGGFVRAATVRPLALDAAEAPELLALVRFLRDRPGMEGLGLGLGAAYLKAAPAGTIVAEAFDAMGAMAERLAWRANAAAARAPADGSRPGDAAIAQQLQVAAGLGVHFESLEREGALTLCYDGEAFRHVLALEATPTQAARAALALTRPDCVAPDLPPLQRWQRDHDDAALLDRVDSPGLAAYERNRLRLRRAAVWATIAFEDSRRLAAAPVAGLPAVTPADVRHAGEEALAALAGVDPAELADDDRASYAEAAVRVGASRWAAEPAPDVRAGAGPTVLAQPGAPGETCVLLVDAKHGAAAPLARRCTYGTVWTASACAQASGRAVALAVQPLAGWRELWLFRKAADGWTVSVLPPGDDASGPGYVEFAGWVPATGQLLVAREARDPAHGGHLARSFELLDAGSLATLRRADSPAALAAFRWQDPAWKRVTVSLR
jgi:hypothetical protein